MAAGGNEDALPGAAERPHSIRVITFRAEAQVHVLARLHDVQVPDSAYPEKESFAFKTDEGCQEPEPPCSVSCALWLKTVHCATL